MTAEAGGMEDLVLGIDFGTTKSVVAVFRKHVKHEHGADGEEEEEEEDGGDVEVLTNDIEARTTPSCVRLGRPSEKPQVGEVALGQALAEPHNTVRNVKRILGRSFEDSRSFPSEPLGEAVELKRDRDREGCLIVAKYSGEEAGVAPEEVAAAVLQDLRETARLRLGRDVRRAVIAVPPHFNAAQRFAVCQAARLAGLEDVRLCNDTSAAALAYARLSPKDTPRTVVVVDVGGGGGSVSVVDVLDSTHVVVRASSGRPLPGGEDLDCSMKMHLLEEVGKQCKTDASKVLDAHSLEKLAAQWREAKKKFSFSHPTAVIKAYLSGVDRDVQMVVEKEVFEVAVAPWLKGILAGVRGTMESAEVRPEDVSDVVLVGASTRVPKLRAAMETFFGRKSSKVVNADEGVAVGAALLAAGEAHLTDVTAHRLTVEISRWGRFLREKVNKPKTRLPIDVEIGGDARIEVRQDGVLVLHERSGENMRKLQVNEQGLVDIHMERTRNVEERYPTALPLCRLTKLSDTMEQRSCKHAQENERAEVKNQLEAKLRSLVAMQDEDGDDWDTNDVLEMAEKKLKWLREHPLEKALIYQDHLEEVERHCKDLDCLRDRRRRAEEAARRKEEEARVDAERRRLEEEKREREAAARREEEARNEAERRRLQKEMLAPQERGATPGASGLPWHSSSVSISMSSRSAPGAPPPTLHTTSHTGTAFVRLSPAPLVRSASPLPAPAPWSSDDAAGPAVGRGRCPSEALGGAQMAAASAGRVHGVSGPLPALPAGRGAPRAPSCRPRSSPAPSVPQLPADRYHPVAGAGDPSRPERAFRVVDSSSKATWIGADAGGDRRCGSADAAAEHAGGASELSPGEAMEVERAVHALFRHHAEEMSRRCGPPRRWTPPDFARQCSAAVGLVQQQDALYACMAEAVCVGALREAHDAGRMTLIADVVHPDPGGRGVVYLAVRYVSGGEPVERLLIVRDALRTTGLALLERFEHLCRIAGVGWEGALIGVSVGGGIACSDLFCLLNRKSSSVKRVWNRAHRLDEKIASSHSHVPSTQKLFGVLHGFRDLFSKKRWCSVLTLMWSKPITTYEEVVYLLMSNMDGVKKALSTILSLDRRMYSQVCTLQNALSDSDFLMHLHVFGTLLLQLKSVSDVLSFKDHISSELVESALCCLCTISKSEFLLKLEDVASTVKELSHSNKLDIKFLRDVVYEVSNEYFSLCSVQLHNLLMFKGEHPTCVWDKIATAHSNALRNELRSADCNMKTPAEVFRSLSKEQFPYLHGTLHEFLAMPLSPCEKRYSTGELINLALYTSHTYPEALFEANQIFISAVKEKLSGMEIKTVINLVAKNHKIIDAIRSL